MLTLSGNNIQLRQGETYEEVFAVTNSTGGPYFLSGSEVSASMKNRWGASGEWPMMEASIVGDGAIRIFTSGTGYPVTQGIYEVKSSGLTISGDYYNATLRYGYVYIYPSLFN